MSHRVSCTIGTALVRASLSVGARGEVLWQPVIATQIVSARARPEAAKASGCGLFVESDGIG
ncbi:PAS domain S-box [Pseudomonas sp. MT-1]|nr:PAS domain S-box [Pseudomonas sp. MT-1]